MNIADGMNALLSQFSEEFPGAPLVQVVEIAGYKMKPGELAGALGFIPNSLTVGRVASRKANASTFMVNGIECRIETLEDKITRLEGGG